MGNPLCGNPREARGWSEIFGDRGLAEYARIYRFRRHAERLPEQLSKEFLIRQDRFVKTAKVWCHRFIGTAKAIYRAFYQACHFARC